MPIEHHIKDNAIMVDHVASLIVELRDLVSDLGCAGGQISPSIYDTAQRLRLFPPQAGVEAGLDWLISRQRQDGGWYDKTVAPARDIPTLAAILAIHKYRQDSAAQQAVREGLGFLAAQAERWSEVHINNVPLGGEMVLPYLLREAEREGFHIDQAPYARLFTMQKDKLERLTRYPFAANSAPTYSWEALEQPFSVEMLDPWTGVGHSPAATVAWLHRAGDAPELAHSRALAEDYLARAEAATLTGIPGVLPVVYPITGFELSYGLYALLIAGLLGHPDLQPAIQPKLAELYAAVERHQGLSFGETFVPDVDSTAVALAVLRSAGYHVGEELVRNFWRKDHFYTYIHEINSSVFSNAHALHALAACGSRCSLTEAYLVERQEAEGYWETDKWHTSWRFCTLEAINALEKLDYDAQVSRAGDALLRDQKPDGRWGDDEDNGILETSYAVLALQQASRHHLLDKAGQAQLTRAYDWLSGERHSAAPYSERWLGKVVYSPYRVDHIYHLSALLAGQVMAVLPIQIEAWAD